MDCSLGVALSGDSNRGLFECAELSSSEAPGRAAACSASGARASCAARKARTLPRIVGERGGGGESSSRRGLPLLLKGAGAGGGGGADAEAAAGCGIGSLSSGGKRAPGAGDAAFASGGPTRVFVDGAGGGVALPGFALGATPWAIVDDGLAVLPPLLSMEDDDLARAGCVAPPPPTK